MQMRVQCQFCTIQYPTLYRGEVLFTGLTDWTSSYLQCFSGGYLQSTDPGPLNRVRHSVQNSTISNAIHGWSPIYRSYRLNFSLFTVFHWNPMYKRLDFSFPAISVHFPPKWVVRGWCRFRHRHFGWAKMKLRNIYILIRKMSIWPNLHSFIQSIKCPK